MSQPQRRGQQIAGKEWRKRKATSQNSQPQQQDYGNKGGKRQRVSPESMNFSWKDKGFRPVVRDSADSDYCFAINSVSTIEGLLYTLEEEKGKGKYTHLSDQHVIDSVDIPPGGGAIHRLWDQYSSKLKRGVATEENYPTVLKDEQYVKRHVNNNNVKEPLVKVKWVSVKPRKTRKGRKEHTDDAIKKRVRIQPVIGFILASDEFMAYEGKGIFSEKLDKMTVDGRKIPADTPCNHAITIVGYGVEGRVEYFEALNCYGTDWGIDGYVKIERTIGRLGEKAYFPVMI